MRKKDGTSLKVRALILLRAALRLGSLCSLLSVTLVSCVPTPKKVGVRGDIPDSSIEVLERGMTSRDEVLLHLGLPDRANQQETLFIYHWSTAWDVFVGGAYQSAPVGGSSEVKEDFALRIEFDDQGIVNRFEKTKEDLSDDSDCEAYEAYIWETITTCYESPTCELAGSLTDSKLYTNEEAGFSIQFPRKWEVRCGQESVTVRASKEVSEGFLAIFPKYVLSVQVAVYPVPVSADVSSLDRSSFLKRGERCPENWTCNSEINVIES